MNSNAHRNHPGHDHDHDPVPAYLEPLEWDQLRDARDAATESEDLAGALAADDALEDRDGQTRHDAGRRTCRACRTWADHVHDPLTGETMRIGGQWLPAYTRADIATTADIAAQAFALASVAPRDQWQELPDGSHRVTVALRPMHLDIRVPADRHATRPYIEDYRLNVPGGGPVWLPVVYANARAATAITDARRYLTPHART
ncbi:hypothetical protein [Nocardia blacklockiae]|uniref:hypothetical protein n=1 Tax=Nocardia blacklockiae TaxID=480036 RepID=UPI001893F75B|nr:hypothetical protein [Nocardia blacklockiae]MBF6176799.1 hypothetical protein [Nocardia blacklockiae]